MVGFPIVICAWIIDVRIDVRACDIRLSVYLSSCLSVFACVDILIFINTTLDSLLQVRHHG
jgi:hypothetical protein